MAGPIRLFAIGQRGVDVVNKPQDLDESELVTGQNCEISSSGGGGALDQRPGMTRINNAPVAGATVMALDVPSQLLTDLTPWLYAGMKSTATHNWRRSSDGTTWVDADTPVKPLSAVAGTISYPQSLAKAVTIGRKLYFVAATTPIEIHSFDGTNDVTLSTIPPAVTGVTLSTPSPPFPPGQNGSLGATTYTYKIVAIAGASHSAASAAMSVTTGPVSLDSTNYIVFVGSNGLPVVPGSGASSYDVYRTVGGATQGKIGSIPISAGAYTTGNGSGAGGGVYPFTDAGLTGDGSSAPSSASGTTAGNALSVIDMITDGANIYLAVLDAIGTDPNPVGRILQFNPVASNWTQIGAAFPTGNGNGTAGALALYDGALSFGTYIGTTSGNTSYLTGLSTPLPAGGVPEVHTFAASLQVNSLLGFNGDLFAATSSLVAGTAAVVVKRKAIATYTNSLSFATTGVNAASTSLYVFNGRLYSGWTNADGTTAGTIQSTPDGINWTTEFTLDAHEMVSQMVTFVSDLYVVCGRSTASFNTKSRILKRTMAGTWSAVDDPSDDFAGNIAVVYL